MNELFDLSSYLITRGVERVFIFQLLHRYSSSHMSNRTVEEYNAAIDETNAFLKTKATQQILYWEHDHSCQGVFHREADNIHLNEKGLKGLRPSAAESLQL